jgi:hypothetical protein
LPTSKKKFTPTFSVQPDFLIWLRIGGLTLDFFWLVTK